MLKIISVVGEVHVHEGDVNSRPVMAQVGMMLSVPPMEYILETGPLGRAQLNYNGTIISVPPDSAIHLSLERLRFGPFKKPVGWKTVVGKAWYEVLKCLRNGDDLEKAMNDVAGASGPGVRG